MPDPTRPFLVLYVVWNPGYPKGANVAESLREHFRRALYENVAGGTGISVIFRSAPAPGSATPLLIDLDEAETTAIVVLADSALAEDPAWVAYCVSSSTARMRQALVRGCSPWRSSGPRSLSGSM